MEKVFDVMSINAVESLPKDFEDDRIFAPISEELLWPVLSAAMEKKAVTLGSVQNTGKTAMDKK